MALLPCCYHCSVSPKACQMLNVQQVTILIRHSRLLFQQHDKHEGYMTSDLQIASTSRVLHVELITTSLLPYKPPTFCAYTVVLLQHPGVMMARASSLVVVLPADDAIFICNSASALPYNTWHIYSPQCQVDHDVDRF